MRWFIWSPVLAPHSYRWAWTLLGALLKARRQLRLIEHHGYMGGVHVVPKRARKYEGI